MNTNDSHYGFMQRALQEASQFHGVCAPNPAVGAVVVRDNHIVAVGAHEGPGLPHAEVVALSQLSTASDCCLYVTLEPCCHYGRTPPCTQKIIEMSIKTVFFAFFDPNPVVAGKGQEALINAGIECHYLPMKTITDFYRPYSKWWHEKRPYLTLKLAVTDQHELAIDTITGAACQTQTHQERLRHDALLTSVNTILADNPKMNGRLIDSSIKKKLYVIDRELRCPLDATIFKTCEPVVLFHSNRVSQLQRERLASANVTLVPIEELHGKLNVLECLDHIAADGVHAVWAELGWQLASALWSLGSVDRFVFYVAQPSVDARTSAFSFVAEAGQDREIIFDHLGDDLCITLS